MPQVALKSIKTFPVILIRQRLKLDSINICRKTITRLEIKQTSITFIARYHFDITSPQKSSLFDYASRLTPELHSVWVCVRGALHGEKQDCCSRC